MEALAQACEHYVNLVEENRRLLKENRRLEERLTIAKKYVGKLHEEITSERVDKIVLEASLKKIDEEHKVTMANLAKGHEETLEKHKRETMQSLQEYLLGLKANFLLHTQACGGIFDALRVSFDALSELTSVQLDLDIYFPSIASWEEFAAKWKSSISFYLPEDPAKTNFSLEHPIDTSVVHVDEVQGNGCEGHGEEEDEMLVYPLGTSSNS
ncbi:hypothetical protein J1N35_033578 [Gossypium stocksii]|uniref:Uncharacterized protein n=1 Tax=Gossypium stocksii TaxID=47602 RepID=A0A9D3UQK0_9ROSI|nr:hypothetical protein J1N35_033578 [Gossypium stocksii]